MWYTVIAHETREVAALVEADSPGEAMVRAEDLHFDQDWVDTGMLLEYEVMSVEEEPADETGDTNNTECAVV